MFKTIEDYLNALKSEMNDADPALVQDALADAREHLTLAVEAAKEKQPDGDPSEVLNRIMDEYGTPEETANAYREVERRTSPALKPTVKSRSIFAKFFGVYADSRAWGALLYMLIAFVTGVFYFTWAVTGLSLSISFAIFIFGLPFALLFLLSVRGLALLEGRLVEALLGIRMPRRPLFSHQGMKWLDRLKALLTDKATWLMLVYMIVQFVLGILYFVVMVTWIALSLSFMALPFIQLVWKIPVIVFGDQPRILPMWELILFSISGFLSLTVFVHVAKGVGQLHGKLAKWMLVSE
ncbi:MAG TPA: sensor domain-containing protein [Anaerolineales bacterium]|nr:sensor domain-containing protein [Anaerolineales bacterium]